MPSFPEIINKKIKNVEQKRIDDALMVAMAFSGVDGSHHKDWVIDQMVRALLGTKRNYQKFVKDACDGEDGADTYTWEEGIAP